MLLGNVYSNAVRQARRLNENRQERCERRSTEASRTVRAHRQSNVAMKTHVVSELHAEYYLSSVYSTIVCLKQGVQRRSSNSVKLQLLTAGLMHVMFRRYRVMPHR